MKYALLIYQNESAARLDEGSPALVEIVGRHMAFSRDLGTKRIGGSGLKSTNTATTLRTVGKNQTVHDGPFAETREQLGGYYMVEAKNLDEAIAIAARIPSAKTGSIEVRPVWNMG